MHIIILLVLLGSSHALQDLRRSNDYLLPLSSDSEPATSSECPHFVHGELRHSLLPASAEEEGRGRPTRSFHSLLRTAAGGGGGGFWTGSLVTVPRPAASVRVVAPGRAGGRTCDSGGAATVADTAALHGCAAAMNAGLFDPGSERCLGNLVSDGVVLHDSAGLKNAHFGITNDGELFFGYLSEDQLKSGMFKQLVGGAIWLVRNGSNYVEDSIKAECSATQTTGSLRRFATVVSARSAVGQYRNGDLVLVQIVGKTDIAGINLFDLADLLIGMGVYNAINLDGGGSSTLVVNGTVVGSPSDYCPDSPNFACLRPVTSVLCVAAVTSDATRAPASPLSPADEQCGPCSPQHGACINGSCVCAQPYTGRGCYERCRCLNSAACHPDTGDCQCPPGYRGPLCESRCQLGFYGPGCARVCVCGNGDQAACDHVNGSCGASASSAEADAGSNTASYIVSLIRRRLESLNWAVIILPGLLSLSCLLNACLLVKCCRLRSLASRHRNRRRLYKQELKRLVEDRNSDSDEEGA